jgi:hypothetical protein
MVRAKFRVSKIELTPGSKFVGKSETTGAPQYEATKLSTIYLYPVTGSSPDDENTRFFASTPSGEIKLGTVSDEAASQFELNKEYYIDFVPAG